MTRKAVVLTVLAVVAVVGLVAGTGQLSKREDVQYLLIYGPERPATSYSVAISFNPETGDWHTGERSWRARARAADASTYTCIATGPSYSTPRRIAQATSSAA